MNVILLSSAIALGQATPPEPEHFDFRPHPHCPLHPVDQPLVLEGDVYVKGDAVNLREGPSTSTKVIVELGIGTAVDADLCAREETIGGKAGCWHPVKASRSGTMYSGYLFSTALTDCRLEVDFDGDGTTEHLYGAVQGDGTIQIRLHDPNDAPHVFWERVKQVDPEYRGHLGVVPAAVAGRALAIVEDMGQDYCGGGSNTDYYSYSPNRGFRKAASAHSFSDSPVYSDAYVMFQPDGTAWMYRASGDADFVHTFTKQAGHAFRPDACAQQDKVCEDGMDRAACRAHAEAMCGSQMECDSFSLRKVLAETGPDYRIHDGARCSSAEAVPSPDWDFFDKDPGELVVIEDSDMDQRCFEDGVYAACPKPWTSPGALFMFEEDSTLVLRESPTSPLLEEAGRALSAEERKAAGIADDETWWVLPREGPAVQVPVKQHLILYKASCGDGYATVATELDFEGTADLAILGSPPPVWMQPAPASTIPRAEAEALVRAALPKRYLESEITVVLTASAKGWEGWAEWCCPDEDDPLYQESTEEIEVRYRVPVTLLEDRSVRVGEPYVKLVEMVGDFLPVLRRDINGDGTLEVLWSGCRNYWTHGEEQVVSNAGDCCGC